MSSGQRRAFWSTTLALAALALVTWFAPSSPPPVRPTAETELLRRLFPALEPSWVVLRLGLTLFATWSLATLAKPGPWQWPALQAHQPAQPNASIWAAGAVTLALAHATALPWTASASTAAQGAWLAASALPALLLALGARLGRRSQPAALVIDSAAPKLIPLWIVPVFVWLLARVWYAPDPLRSADLVDTWQNLQRVHEVLAGKASLFGDTFLAGAPNTYMIFEGVPLFGHWGRLPDAGHLVWSHALCWSLAAAAIGDLVARRGGAILGALAAAALLFSPFALHTNLSLAPIFLGPLAAAGLVWLLERWWRSNSVPAFALLGPAIGFCAHVPALVPIAALTGATCLWTAWRRRISLGTLLLFGVPLCALAWLAVPSPQTIEAMVSDYTTGSAIWIQLERTLMGQLAPVHILEGWTASGGHPIDVPLGALLSPWLAARTPLRAWGDSLYDPFSAVAFTVGILFTIARARRNPEAAWLLAALALAIAPGLLSSYDRPSHTRMFCAPVFFAIFSAVGLDATSKALATSRRSLFVTAWGLTAAIFAVGLFDLADAARLERSFLSIGLRRAAQTKAPALIIRHEQRGDLSWLHSARITQALATSNVTLASRDTAVDSLRHRDSRIAAFVSPGLEEAERSASYLCEHTRGASVVMIHDQTGNNHAFAVTQAPELWSEAGQASSILCSDWAESNPVTQRPWTR